MKDSAKNFNKSHRLNINKYVSVIEDQRCIECGEYKDKESFRAKPIDEMPFHSRCYECRDSKEFDLSAWMLDD